MSCPIPEQEARIRELERDLALERKASEDAEQKFREINGTLKKIDEKIDHVDKQTAELQTVRRIIRWSVSVVLATAGTAAAVWKTWFKTGAS